MPEDVRATRAERTAIEAERVTADFTDARLVASK